MTAEKYMALLKTDSLALFVLGGFVVLLLVSVGVIAFLMTRKDKPHIPR